MLDEGETGLARGQEVLGRINLVRVNDRVLHSAGVLLPADLRSLDSIHLATALHLGDDVRQLVTYDERMAAAALTLGVRAVSPM